MFFFNVPCISYLIFCQKVSLKVIVVSTAAVMKDLSLMVDLKICKTNIKAASLIISKLNSASLSYLSHPKGILTSNNYQVFTLAF